MAIEFGRIPPMSDNTVENIVVWREEPTIQPFELMVGNGERITNADVPVRWCITPDFITKMEEDNVNDPHILLMSYNPGTGREVHRSLTPVGELMTYVRFHQPGEMKIFGWIVSSRDRGYLHQRLMQLTHGEYPTELIEPFMIYDENDRVTGRAIRPRDNLPEAYIGTETNVTIPDNVFAKKPNPKVNWYVNLWHNTELQDGCHFRKRALLSIPKFIPFTIWVAITLLIRTVGAGGLTLSGFPQYVRWKSILHPFEWSMSSFYREVIDLSTQRFLFWSTGAFSGFSGKDPLVNGSYVRLSALPLTPIFPLFFFTLAWLTSSDVGTAAVHTGTALATFVGIFFLVDVVVSITAFLIYELESKWAAVDDWITEREIGPQVFLTSILGSLLLCATILITLWPYSLVLVFLGIAAAVGIYLWKRWIFLGHIDQDQNDLTEIRELLCPAEGMNLRASYKYIPKEQRSFRLWLKSLKNNVCKPMQH